MNDYRRYEEFLADRIAAIDSQIANLMGRKRLLERDLSSRVRVRQTIAAKRRKNDPLRRNIR